MAHLFFLPPPIPVAGAYSRANKRLRHRQRQCPEEMSSSRNTSVSSNATTINSNSNTCTNTSTPSPAALPARSTSASARSAHHVFTHSIPGSSAVTIYRESPPSDDDVILVTVKLSNPFRRSSVAGADELPERPPKRGFWRRMTTRINERWDHASEKEERYTVVKMPRGEYRRAQGREWDEDELEREFGRWQGVGLRS